MKGVTVNLLVCVVAACFGTQFQFYNNVVGNNIADVVQRWFNESYIEHYDQNGLSKKQFSLIYSITTSCLQIGAVISSLATKVIAERLGRRKTLILTAFLEAVGAILVGLSKLATSLELFGVGRFIIGLGFGAGSGVASMLISELAPIKVRGAIGTIQQIFIGLGMVGGFVFSLPMVFGTDALWPIAITIPAVPALIQMLIMLRVHESPKYLLLTMKNREASMQSLQFYKGKKAAVSSMAELESEQNQVNSGRQISFVQMLSKRVYHKPLIISFMVMFAIQFTGIAPIMAYSKTIFTSSGLDAQAAEFASVGLGLMNLVCPFLVLVLIERLGRRILLLAGLSVTFVALLVTTILIQLADQYKNNTLLTVAIPFVYIFQIGYAVGSSVTWIMPSELFPQNVRAYGVSVAVVSYWLAQLITLLCYLPYKDAVGVPLSMVPFLVVTLICIVFFAVYLPETKGTSPERLILDNDVKNHHRASQRRTARVAPVARSSSTNHMNDDAKGEEADSGIRF